MKNIVIFASGSGSNALNLIQHFKNSRTARIAAVFTNKAEAGVVQHAEAYHIPVRVFNKTDFYDTNHVLDALQELHTDLIVLAGFLWLVPAKLVQAYPGRIINIHPSLLPKFGGKGMYGDFVHKAVIEAGETESGISIHLVDEEFDRGDIISQHKTTVSSSDSPESLRRKIQALEQAYLPAAVEAWCNKL